ncbi:MAG: ABC transporter ATP-binding protein [Defluviitaleaceae bacterium]|nr:ABC transporter ATP-binding protein [Defluviitaleaceae bacterium]
MEENRLINLIDVSKTFDGYTKVLDNINLYIKKNEFLTLLGPSGCGKTTTLRIIGGFETPSSGDLLFEGESILGLAPHKRRVNTVFQKYALFPNMNVYDNVAFGLNIKKVDKNEIKKEVSRMLELVNLNGFEKRSVNSLSGGQQQRIAIARALINKPEVLLLDEPLGALDLKLRKEMQIELKNMQKELSITFVYVTHDQEEALTMSDTIAVMHGGIIKQIGSPEDIYNEPKNAFVANFIGESNIISGVMHKNYEVTFAGHTFPCIDKNISEDTNVDVIIRPEDIKIVSEDMGQLKGVVKNVKFLGIHYEMHVEASEFTWKVQSTVLSPEGSNVGLTVAPDLIHVMKKDEVIAKEEADEE